MKPSEPIANELRADRPTELQQEATLTTPEGQAKRGKKPYRSPQLTRHGDLRALTMGASPGTGESGQPMVFRT